MADLNAVSVVIVTKGDRDLDTILGSLAWCDDVVVWNNADEVAAGRDDLICYGRHVAAMERARHDLIYTQDDDCLCPAAGLVQAYDGTMLVNVPDDEAPLTAWGAVYSRQTVHDAFHVYLDHYPPNRDLLVCADVIHTALTPWRRHHLGHLDFDYAYGPDRMHRQDNHYRLREIVARRAERLAGIPA